MLINNAVITGSFIVNGTDVTGITGSSAISSSYLALSSSYLVTSASYAQSSASLSIRTGNLEATASTLVSASGSFAAQSASLSTRLTTDEANITTLTTASASFAVVSSSFSSTSQSVSSRVTLIEGQYATTGSNNFTGPQYVNQASNAISFTSTASLYTDGGLRVTKDSFVSGTAYFNNVIVYGTASIQYVTSSQVNVGTNIITVNTDTPAVRFGGLAVFDSGSTQLTGSILWDSEKNNWIYSNPSGSTYNSGMLMNGPKNTGSLGTEQGTLNNYITKGQGGDHITSSQIIDDGTTVQIPGNLQVTGSLINTGAATFSSSALISGVLTLSSTITNGTYTYTLPSATGTLALTSAIPANPVGGTGTTNYLPKFTGTSTIGNSLVYDTGTNVLINQGATDNGKGARLQITQSGNNTNGIDLKNTDATYGHIGTFGNNLYLTQNYYYSSGQNYDSATFGQAAINLAAGTTNTSTISFALSDAGATSPSTKMILNSSGNLGLGVTPSAWSLGKVVEVGTLGNAFWGLGINSVQLASNYFYDGSYKYANNGYANRYDIGSSGGSHIWFNAPSGTTGNAITFTQAMTLDASGNLFVGVASGSNTAGFTNKVYVEGSLPSLTLSNTGASTGKFTIGVTAGCLGIWNNGTSTYPIFINSTNNIGIGTSTDSGYKLDVNGTGRFSGALTVNLTSAASAITLVNTSTNNIFTTYSNASNNTYIGLISNNGAIQTNNDFEVYTGASYTKRLTIASTGVATFSGDLYVNGTNKNLQVGNITIPTTDSGIRHIFAGSGVFLGQDGVGEMNIGNNFYFNSAFLRRNTDAVSNIRFNAGLIYLQVAASGAANSAITWTNAVTIANSGAATFSGQLNISYASYPEQRITDGTIGYQMYASTGASDFVCGTYTNHNLIFRTNAVQRLSIASTGAATFSSGISVGGATATTGGIQFPATAVAIADANNLDDYEEGTWTPTLTTSGGTPPTVVSSSGRYIIIGKLVTIYFKFLLSSASGGSGQLKITNAPFSLNLSTIPAVGFARITDLGLTLNCGFLTGTVINFNKYDGNYAGTDYETVGQVSYYND